MKYERLKTRADDIAQLGGEVSKDVLDPHSAPKTLDEFVDALIGLDEILDEVTGLADFVKMIKDRTAKTVSDLFVEKEQSSVTARGKTVYLANEYWPGPRYKDLLPEGVDEEAPEYASTVAQCRAAAKERLLLALKSSANFSDLVAENWNASSLRSALTGPNAPKDKLDNPELPPELAEIVELNPRSVVRVVAAKKSKAAKGGVA